MEKKELETVELAKIAGGFPDGEMPAGKLLCIRCGAGEDDLELIDEGTVNLDGYAIESLVPDKTLRAYKCKVCGMRFVVYGPFWQKF
jgi:hypothetical protein